MEGEKNIPSYRKIKMHLKRKKKKLKKSASKLPDEVLTWRQSGSDGANLAP